MHCNGNSESELSALSPTGPLLSLGGIDLRWLRISVKLCSVDFIRSSTTKETLPYDRLCLPIRIPKYFSMNTIL